MKFGLAIISIVLFSLVLWATTFFWFGLVASIEHGINFASALLSTAGLIVVFLALKLLMAALPWHTPSLIVFCIAAAVWSLGLYLIDIRPRGNFSFYMYGDSMIVKGRITDHGYAIFNSIFLSKVTTALIFAAIWIAYLKIWRRES